MQRCKSVLSYKNFHKTKITKAFITKVPDPALEYCLPVTLKLQIPEAVLTFFKL